MSVYYIPGIAAGAGLVYAGYNGYQAYCASDSKTRNEYKDKAFFSLGTAVALGAWSFSIRLIDNAPSVRHLEDLANRVSKFNTLIGKAVLATTLSAAGCLFFSTIHKDQERSDTWFGRSVDCLCAAIGLGGLYIVVWKYEVDIRYTLFIRSLFENALKAMQSIRSPAS